MGNLDLASLGLSQEEITTALRYLSDEEASELDSLLTSGLPAWMPLPGPQTTAYECMADVIGYGGAAGGGKSSLICGLAVNKHHDIAIFRREGTQTEDLRAQLAAIVGKTMGLNADIWRLSTGQKIEWGSCPNPGDEKKRQGRAADLMCFDEATEFLEAQVRFIMGWNRTKRPGQKCTALLTFNPPTTAEGRWIIAFFAPWLDPDHPNPAAPGELRWYAQVDGVEREVKDGTPFRHHGELIKPMSRTFIPSRISDNPYLLDTNYMATLQALPEPLRSQMLKGDFSAGIEDDPWQVCPTAWVLAAMARWRSRDKKGPMDSMGVDVSRGGRDSTIISRRHGTWFDELLDLQGTMSPDGPTVAGQVIAHRRDRSPVHIDIIGWGSSPYDFLVDAGVQTIGINGSETGFGVTDDEACLRFLNKRAEIWWRMREALDPNNPNPIALPPDQKLRADLCAPKWFYVKGGIRIELKEELVKRIGRSPDRGDAVVMANIDTVPDVPRRLRERDADDDLVAALREQYQRHPRRSSLTR